MPWKASDAKRHTKKAASSKLKGLWQHVANQVLEATGNEGRAVREANAVVVRRKKK